MQTREPLRFCRSCIAEFIVCIFCCSSGDMGGARCCKANRIYVRQDYEPRPGESDERGWEIESAANSTPRRTPVFGIPSVRHANFYGTPM